MPQWLNRLLCGWRGHTLTFHRNIHGDEIIEMGWKRSMWKCSECGAFKLMDALHNEGKQEMSASRADFEAWFRASKYSQVIHPRTSDECAAWDGWQASRSQPERKLTDAAVVEVLASFGVDSKKSIYGFDALQVATSIPTLRLVIEHFLAAQPAAATVPDKSISNHREIGAKLPNGSVVTNVYDAFNEGLKAATVPDATDLRNEGYDVVCDRRDLFDFLRAAWRSGQDHGGRMSERERWERATNYAVEIILGWATLRHVPQPPDAQAQDDGAAA